MQEILNRKIIQQYYIYKFVSNLWFLSAVWLYFYRLFITDREIGIIDGLAFFIGLLAEVPSGALADRIGHKKIAQLGQILAGIGILIQALGQDYVAFLVGQTIMMMGVSCISGADETLFYSNLGVTSESKTWKKILTRGAQWTLIGTLLSTAIGGWLHTINPIIPWILTGLSFIYSAFLLSGLTESPRTSENKTLSDIFAGSWKTIRNGFIEFSGKEFAYYIPIIFFIQGLFYASGYGTLRLFLLDRFGFSPFIGSIVLCIIILITIVGLEILHNYMDKISEVLIFMSTGLLSIFALIISVYAIGYWGAVVILILYAGQRVLYIAMNDSISRKSNDANRATMLSIKSFLRIIPYIILAPILGYLNSIGLLSLFLISWSILILLSLIAYNMLRK